MNQIKKIVFFFIVDLIKPSLLKELSNMHVIISKF